MKSVDIRSKKEQRSTQILLRRIAACEASRKYLEDIQPFDEQLADFVAKGLESGDKVIVVATAKRLTALEQHLRTLGYDIFTLSIYEQYVPLDADKLLDRFLVKWWPDAVLFRYLVTTLAARMLKTDRNLRVFSEMSAQLWISGHPEASAQLEIIWNKLVESRTDYEYVKITNEVGPPFGSEKVQSVPMAQQK